MERETERQREQCGHARCLLVYLASPSTLQQLTQQQEGSFQPNQGCCKISNTHVIDMNISQHMHAQWSLSSQLFSLTRSVEILQKLIPEWSDELNTAVVLNCIPEIQCMPVSLLWISLFFSLCPLFSISFFSLSSVSSPPLPLSHALSLNLFLILLSAYISSHRRLSDKPCLKK